MGNLSKQKYSHVLWCLSLLNYCYTIFNSLVAVSFTFSVSLRVTDIRQISTTDVVGGSAGTPYCRVCDPVLR